MCVYLRMVYGRLAFHIVTAVTEPSVVLLSAWHVNLRPRPEKQQQIGDIMPTSGLPAQYCTTKARHPKRETTLNHPSSVNYLSFGSYCFLFSCLVLVTRVVVCLVSQGMCSFTTRLSGWILGKPPMPAPLRQSLISHQAESKNFFLLYFLRLF